MLELVGLAVDVEDARTPPSFSIGEDGSRLPRDLRRLAEDDTESATVEDDKDDDFRLLLVGLDAANDAWDLLEVPKPNSTLTPDFGCS